MNPMDILSSQFDYYGGFDSDYVGSLTPIIDRIRSSDNFRYHPPETITPSTPPSKYSGKHTVVPSATPDPSSHVPSTSPSTKYKSVIDNPIPDKSMIMTDSIPPIHLRQQSMPTELPSYESYQRFPGLPPDSDPPSSAFSPIRMNNKTRQSDRSNSPSYNLVIDIHVHEDGGIKRSFLLDNEFMSKSLQIYGKTTPLRQRMERANSLEQLNNAFTCMDLESEDANSFMQSTKFEEAVNRSRYNWCVDGRMQRMLKNETLAKAWGQKLGRSNSMSTSRYRTPIAAAKNSDLLFYSKRYPEIPELLHLLESPETEVIVNATACLQHLVYRNSNLKEKTRQLGGISLLICLLYSENARISHNVTGVLRNLTCGDNLEIKEEVERAGGIRALAWLIRRFSKHTLGTKHGSHSILESAAGRQVENTIEGAVAVLCNLASVSHLKQSVLQDAVLSTLVPCILRPVAVRPFPNSNRDIIDRDGEPSFNRMSFRNVTAVLRNVSGSDSPQVREQLRQCPSLLASLLTILRAATNYHTEDSKSVEHCICTVRNLCYFTQSLPTDSEHPNDSVTSRANRSSMFGSKTSLSMKRFRSKENGSKKIPEEVFIGESRNVMNIFHRTSSLQIMIDLLQTSSNPYTLEAAAGTIQNLTVVHCPNSKHIQTLFRKIQVLPVLVELINSPSRRVATSVIHALSNLARDEQNCKLLGKHGSISILTALRKCFTAFSTAQNASQTPRSSTMQTRDEWYLPNEGQIGSLSHLTRPQHQKCFQSIYSARAVAIALLDLCMVLICDDVEQARRFVTLGGVDICQDLLSITNQCDSDEGLMRPVYDGTLQVLRRLWSFIQLKPIYKLAGWSAEDFGVYKRSGRLSSLVRRRPKPPNTRSATPISKYVDTNSRSSTISKSEVQHWGHSVQPPAIGMLDVENYCNVSEQTEFDNLTDDTIISRNIPLACEHGKELDDPEWVPQEWLANGRRHRIYLPGKGYNFHKADGKLVQGRGQKIPTSIDADTMSFPHLISEPQTQNDQTANRKTNEYERR